MAEKADGHPAAASVAMTTAGGPSVVDSVVATPAAEASAPVFCDSDSLAFRELLAQPTEHAERLAMLPSGPRELVQVKILGFNDFHGSLSSSRILEGRPIGGAAVLASYLREHARAYEGRVVIANAGDFVGASPAVSSLFQDEPSIEFLNQLSNGRCDRAGVDRQCNLLATLGNHEFDDGTAELLRLVRGGKHPSGDHFGSIYRGQVYPTICANVVDVRTGRFLLPPYVIKNLGGAKVGFVGAVVSGASWFLKKSGIKNVRFEDETRSINASVSELKKQGVRAVVLLLHQGGRQRFSRDLPRDASAVSGEIREIVAQLDGEVDLVVSGHTHSALSALIPNRDGRPTLVTQALHSGTAFADIFVDIDTASGNIVKKRAAILSTFADAGPGLVPDPKVLQLVRQAEQAAERTTRTVLGKAVGEISSNVNEHGESPMGDLVADAQRRALRADFAFTTPSWVRADLLPGPVTWGDLFTIQPFGNRLMSVELLGSQVVELLNQQWTVETYPRMLQVSGLSFAWDGRKPADARIVEVLVGQKPIEAGKTYVAAVNEFLAEGGEGYSLFAKLPREASAVLDIDALVAYIRNRQSIEPRFEQRIRRIDLE